MDLAARAAVVQPAAQRDGLSFVPGDVFDVGNHVVRRASGRARTAAARAGPPRARAAGLPVFGQLHQVRARRSRSSASSSAPRPSRSCRDTGTRCSSSRPWLSCTCVAMMCSATVSTASAHVAHQVRVAEVEADAGVGALELALEHRDQRGRRPTAVRDDFERDAHAERLGQPADLLDAAHRRGAMVVAGVGLARRACRGARPATSNGIRSAICQRRFRLPHRRLAPRRLGRGVRERRRPLVAGAEQRR